jgi:uncharacterized protein (TIGR02391 family)
MMFSSFGSTQVVVIKHEGTDAEERHEVEALIQAETGYFAVDAPIDEGDVVLVANPRGGTARKLAAKVLVDEAPPRMSSDMSHTEVVWGSAPAPRAAPVRRLAIENLHPGVIAAASDLFVDGHYSQAVFEACKALEVRVRAQSGLDLSGRELMNKALASGDRPPINVAAEDGQSGRDEQEGIRFLLMGLMQGIRNPKGHGLVRQVDPQRALEHLALVSILFRRLDDASER